MLKLEISLIPKDSQTYRHILEMKLDISLHIYTRTTNLNDRQDPDQQEY